MATKCGKSEQCLVRPGGACPHEHSRPRFFRSVICASQGDAQHLGAPGLYRCGAAAETRPRAAVGGEVAVQILQR